MTAPTNSLACPNCGATVRFRWAQAVQTTCEYCRSVLVRTDVALELVGTQASFPATGSPIQLGTEGTWRQQRFTVVGRITYQWSRGRWNEWHCILADGSSAWLADAQLEYTMTVAAPLPGGGVDVDALRVGDRQKFMAREYEVAGFVDAAYVGTEGDLPFTSWDKRACRFVDFQSNDGRFATVDGTERPPLVFVGEYLRFDELALRNLREFDGWGPPE